MPVLTFVIASFSKFGVDLDHVLLGLVFKHRWLASSFIFENIGWELSFIIEALGD
jgi:hypothetical protein